MAENVDYTKSSAQQSPEKGLSARKVLDALQEAHFSNADRKDVEAHLTDDKLGYSPEAVEAASALLQHIHDSGYHYDAVARNDGAGILLKMKNGASSTQVTLITPDHMGQKRDGSGEELKRGVNNVGNVYTSGKVPYSYSYNASANRNLPQQPYLMMDILMGKLPTNATFDARKTKDSAQSDQEYIIRMPRKAGDHYTRRVKDRKTGKYHEQVINNYFYKFNRHPDDYAADYQPTSALADIDPELIKQWDGQKISPLAQLAAATNVAISRREQDDDGYVTLEDGRRFKPMDFDAETLEDLDLDALIAFNDRSIIQDAYNQELKHGRAVDLFGLKDVVDENGIPTGEMKEKVTGALGLKNLLLEGSAGLDALMVDDEKLPVNYQQYLKQVQSMLRSRGIQNGEVHFDRDHVLHWAGDTHTLSQFGVNSKRGKGDHVTGKIGQIFLPEADGVIQTRFVSAKDQPEDRNYLTVPGYSAFYAESQPFPSYIPHNGELVLTNRDGSIFKLPNGEPQPVTMREMRAMAEPGGLKAFNDKINKGNTGERVEYELNPDKPAPLDMRIRLRGFDQELRDKVEGTLTAQIMQGRQDDADAVAVNKLYHGDMYATRITPEARKNKDDLDHLRHKLRFDSQEVEGMTPEELGADFQYDVHHSVVFELDEDGKPDPTRPKFQDKTHRQISKDLLGIIDPIASSDGKALGYSLFINQGVETDYSGKPKMPENLQITGTDSEKEAALKTRLRNLMRSAESDGMEAIEGDPLDRNMMAQQQESKKREKVENEQVALMSYRGYTFEDGCVVSQKFADAHQLNIGDKLSDDHGNKATISYIADPTDPKDRLFAQNPDLNVIMNPHSITSRQNTGVVIEMQRHGDIKPVTLDGDVKGHSGELSVIVTNITAESKTHIYDESEARQGRNFGNQEAWAAGAMGLNGVMKEAFKNNGRALKRFSTIRKRRWDRH